ncbi:hypothetical protein LCGC14_2497260 [marine sediment metagenome]|uniref:Uncharacterized protein n=1 Tax=marine sediment metagenome TaxID=412755 RepID=A0A0F9BQZ5_9ZZZZ
MVGGVGWDLEAAGRAGAGIVPAIGPFAAEIGEAIGEKRLGKVAAKGLELSFGFSRTRAGLKPLKGIPKRVAGKIGRALRPRQSAKVALRESLPISLEELKTNLRITNKRPPQSLQELQQLTSEARQLVGKEIEATLGKSKTSIILGDDLIAATKKGISKPSRLLDDKAVAQLENTIDRQLKGKQFTLTEAESLRQQLNAELGTFFEKNKIKQRKAAVTEVPIQARLALREALEQQINNILGDSKLSSVRKRYGALRRLEDATTDRIVSEMFKDASLAEQLFQLESLDTLAAGGAIAAGALGQFEVAAAGLTVVAARRVLVTIGRKLREPNLRVRQAFSQLDKPRKANISGPLLFLLAGQEDKAESKTTTIPSTIP